MNLLINSDVLLDYFFRKELYPESFKLIDELIADDRISGWISAISILDANNYLLANNPKNNDKNCLKFLTEKFSIIPFRNSIVVKSIRHDFKEFKKNILITSAEMFKMDYIITRNTNLFKNSSLPAITPTDFLISCDASEPESKTPVPFLDLKAQHHQVYCEIDDRITDIIADTSFILGKHVEEFEKCFKEIQQARYCIGTSSGTDALHIALMALNIGPNDMVIVPVNTFIATAEAVSLVGAVPVFVDCDEYHQMDGGKLEELLRLRVRKDGLKVKAIIPVHLFGQPANIDKIMALCEEYDLKVVEDCCQAHLAEWQGEKVGNFGAFGAFSFYPGKNLGAYGEAGALITNSENLYMKAKMIGRHGEMKRYQHKVIGHNYRMEAFQGAVLATKLKYLENWTQKRQKNALIYNELLSEVEGLQTPKEFNRTSCVYHLYVIQTSRRNGLQEYLQQNGIGTGIHYPIPIHLQTAYKHLGYKIGDFPIAEKASERILSLPMFPELAEGQIRYVCDNIKDYMQRVKF